MGSKTLFNAVFIWPEQVEQPVGWLCMFMVVATSVLVTADIYAFVPLAQQSKKMLQDGRFQDVNGLVARGS